MSDRIKYSVKWTEADKKALDDLFFEARAKGLWFFHGGFSGPLWLSPDELQKEQDKGNFIWGAINWELRDPHEHLDTLVNDITNAEKAYKAFLKRLK
jgi:hypothetical protein